MQEIWRERNKDKSCKRFHEVIANSFLSECSSNFPSAPYLDGTQLNVNRTFDNIASGNVHYTRTKIDVHANYLKNVLYQHTALNYEHVYTH